MFIKNDYKKYIVIQEDGAIGDECDYNSFAALFLDNPTGYVHIELKHRKDASPNSEKVVIPGGFTNFVIEGNNVIYTLNGGAPFTIQTSAGKGTFRNLACNNGANASDVFFILEASSHPCFFENIRGYHGQGNLFYINSSFHTLRNLYVENPTGMAQVMLDNASDILIDSLVSYGGTQSEAVRILNNSVNTIITNLIFEANNSDVIYIDSAMQVKISNCKMRTFASGKACINNIGYIEEILVENCTLEAIDYCIDTVNSPEVNYLIVDNCYLASSNYQGNPINEINTSKMSLGKIRPGNLQTIGNGFKYFETPIDYINGFYWNTNNINFTQIDIWQGVCKDSLGEHVCNLDSSNSIYPLVIDGTVAGAGGLDGTMAFTAGNWFALYVIWDSRGVNPISAIAGNWINSQPNMPSGYDRWRYIGSLKCKTTGTSWMMAEARGNNERDIRVLEDRSIKLWGSISGNTGKWGAANISSFISPKPGSMLLGMYAPSGNIGYVEIRGYQQTWATNGQYRSQGACGLNIFEITNNNASLFDYRPLMTSGSIDLYGEGWKEQI